MIEEPQPALPRDFYGRLPAPPARRRGAFPWLRLAGGVLLLAASVAAALLWLRPIDEALVATKGGRRAGGGEARAPVPPKEPLPQVEPLQLRALSADAARAANAAVPFSRAPNPAAKPFAADMTPLDLARATDCLAAALLYEAGDDAMGERAVAQVVLNRVRHPAFPHTVCGVVFQGSERATGCQFTFTCDGALARRPRPVAWERARILAGAALAGSVFAPVGHATHYHTDWVVPYWSASLEKIVAVKTHLFFRWAGGWGRPAAFYVPYAASEPAISAIAALSDAHRDPAPDAKADALVLAGAGSASPAGPAAPAPAPRFAPTARDPDVFLVQLGSSIVPDDYPGLAEAACAARRRCLFIGWPDTVAAPKALPATTAQLEEMVFHYLRDPAFAAPRTRWDCNRVRRTGAAQCLSRQAGMAAPPAKAPPEPSVTGSATP